MSSGGSHNYIVAVGASAGGLEAFTEFLSNAQENKKLSYILIQHLSSDYKSVLAELLSRHTRLKVMEAEDGVEIQPNHVYVSPPRKYMAILDNKLSLTDKDPHDKSPNTSIDIFLQSLAKEFEEQAIAVILSGTGTDGSRGVEAIKAAGGLVIAQEPSTAKFDGMPNSAIATGLVDLVLPVHAMFEEIRRYVSEIPEESVLRQSVPRDTLNKIHKLVMLHTGADFREYKLPTLLRRLNRRLTFLKLQNAEAYVQYLENNPDEGRFFCRELLIGVTRFFRDKDAFESLRENALEPLVASKEDNDHIKVWIPACSSGEEAYSIAILLNEVIRDSKKSIDVKIFASDLEPLYLEKASAGHYPQFIEKEIPAELLQRYFVKKDGFYTISSFIRKQIVFARHNVISDPPFIKNDLISCRNLLIYMNTILQKQVLSKFRFSLNNFGYLFLGSSENPVGNNDGLEERDRKWKIYCKIRKTNNSYEEKMPDMVVSRGPGERAATHEQAQHDPVRAAIFEDLSVGGFYVDQHGVIHETVGNFRRFLVSSEDPMKMNLIKLLPDSVSVALSNGLFKALKHNEPRVLRNIYVRDQKSLHSVEISIRPNCNAQGLSLISLHAVEVPVANEGHAPETGVSEVARLEAELRETRFSLQEAIEELQSSNEELLSSNEELQSSNEELQSLNEELHTLNTEHQQRIRDLTELNDDLNNYFRGSDIGQIIVDKNLRIRKFNPAAMKMVNIIENDVDRPITDLTINFDYEGYENDIRDVLRSNKVVEREATLDNGRSMLVRIHSYVTQQNTIEGALLSFVDITSYKDLYNIVNGVFEATQAAIIVLKAVRRHHQVLGFNVVTGNDAASRLFGTTVSQKIIPLKDLDSALNERLFADLSNVVLNGETYSTEIELAGKWFDAVAVPMPGGAAVTLNDISARKMSEVKLRQNYAELYAAKEKLRTFNQNLENMVQVRTRELSQSEERFRLVSRATNDIVVDWTFKDNSVWLGDNYYRLFGYDPDKPVLTHSEWLERIHPADRQRVIDSIHGQINKGAVLWKQEYRYMQADKEFRHISDRGFLLKDENEVPYRMISSMMDVTELRKTEKELRESEMRLRMALDVSGFASWDYNLQTEKLIYSEKLPVIFGHKAARGFTMDQIRSQYHAEDQQLFEKMFENGDTLKDSEHQARVTWPDGSLHWIGTHGKLFFDENGKPSRLIGITREITVEKKFSLELEDKVRQRTAELSKKNEALLRQKDFNEAIIQSSVNAISVLDKNHRITSANQSFEAMFGLLKEQVIGKSFDEVYTTSSQESMIAAVKAALEGRHSRTVTIMSREGRNIHLENFFTPLMHKLDVYGVLISSHNISGIIEANERLQALNNQLARSNSDLEQFAYIASHDLQEPLRKIQTFISIIREKEDDSKTIEQYMEKIAASAARMSGLITNVLQYSRLSNVEKAFIKVDLNESLQQLIIDFELSIRERHATINISPLPVISAVPHQINQLFFNLISNGLKFCARKPVINITSAVLSEEEKAAHQELDKRLNYHRISVQDNGIGFEQEYAEKIFSFFYRLDNKGVYPGSGIGLAICKKIVLNHNGAITAFSKKHKGTEFVIILPETQE